MVRIMNCKPGDLAVIVNTLPAGKFLLGRIVEVMHRVEDHDEGPAWWVRLSRDIRNPIDGMTGSEGTAADCFLRPIRDPGDDAQDEMLRPLPQEIAA
jgi:hypothetical protein